MLTAVLSRADVLRNVQALHLLKEMHQAVVEVANRVESPLVSAQAQQLKVRIGQHPSLATSTALVWSADQAVMHVYQHQPQRLLALLDATALVDIATSLLLATAVDRLAPESIRRVAIIGGGESAKQTLKALRLVRSIERTALYESDLAANTELAFRLKKSLDAAIESTDSPGQAIEDAEVIIVTKGQPLPISRPRPGAIVCLHDDRTLASAQAPSWLTEARVVSDGSAKLTSERPVAIEQLGDVNLSVRSESVIVFITQLPTWVDAVAGWHVCEGLKTDEQVTRIALEA